MARLMSENSVSHPDCSAASSSASTSNATSPSPRTSRKPAASTMATEENNNNTSPKRISLQRTSSTKLRGKTVSPPRRTSFKLQQIRPGGPKNGYRATKVTVPSNSVALLASRFNAVVVHNDAEGRKLLKRLNSQKQILHHTHKSTTIEGCVRAAIKKFESGDCGEHGDEHVVSSNQNSHHLQNAVDKGGKEKASHQNKNNHHHHHRLQNAVEKHGKEKVNNDDSHQNNNHHSRNGVEKNGKEKDNDVNQNSANVHHQQAERPKFVIVRKNSSISKFSRKSLQKTNVNSTQNSRLSSVESSKDVLMKSGSSVSSSGSSPVKSVRKFPNPPKPTPKPTINQRTIFLKPVLSKCTESSVRLKDNVDNGVSGSSVRLSRTVKEDHLKSSKTDVRLSRTVKEDKSSKTDVRNSGRADLDDSVFCSGDETDGKSSDGVPKTVKKIWRKYQVTNSRSISSIARDFINSDSSLDGSVVQTLKNVRENVDDSSTEKNGNKGSSKKDPDNNKHLVEQCEACETGVKSTQEVEKRNHSKLCRVQRRIHHGNEDSKVQKEVFRKYLVKSEHIMAVQNELLATNKKFDSKNVKETRNGNNVGKEHRRYGRIIVNDTKVLKSLVNDDVNNEDTVNKENLEKSIKHDSSVVGKNVQAITKNLEDTSVIASKPQVIKPKLQPKPSKLPECIRKVEVVAKEISTPAKSKPITTPGIRLSVAKDQTILESALNGTLLKEQNKLMNGDVSKNVKENCVMETGGMNKSGQKDFVKPNRSFLWNTLKDKESSQDLVVPVAETLVHNVTSTAESTKNEDVMSQPKPKEVFDANIRNNLDSKVKNTSFLFRKNVKSLPNDDSLDEPIYMNGQVALSTSDLDSRMSATDIGSNFSSMINGLDGVKSKTHITVVGSNLGTMKNGQVALNSNGDLARGRNKGHIIDAGSYSVATENGQIGQEGNIKLVGPNFTKDVDENEGQNEVYEEFGNSDNEGTIYEDLDASSVDGSPKTVPNDPNFKSVNVYITEERNTNIIQVETVNKVVIVSQQVAGYEEIEKESTKGSGGYSGSKLRYTHIDSDVATKRVTDDTYASITGQDVCENIYDDVIHLKPKIHAEVDSCHYECIYQSEIGGSSHSDSSCDQSNSLYGVVPGSKLSQSSYGVYQLNEPRANTSETSDEWIDLDTSGGDVEIYLYEKRNKPKVKSAGSWSQKVRRQWSAKQAGNSSWDGSSDYENTSHQYEAVQGLHSTTTSSNIRRTVPRQEFSFDSDSSFEDDDEEDHPQRTSVPQGRPEEPPQQNEGIYGFMKQASKRMRKHWSLGKSLRRIRKMSVGTSLGTSVEEQEGSVTNGSNTSLNRRRWSSFKSKFRPQLSSSGSVFYLDKDQTDTPDCIPNVYIDKPSPTTPQPVATIATSTATTTTDTRRYSYASSSSVRPTSPPPPPPPPPHRQALCEELLAKRGVLKSPPGVERTGGVERSLAGVEKSPVGVEKSPTGIEKSPGNGEMALGNRSWQSENDDSWDRRMSGMDMMSDRSSSHGSDLHLRFADEPLYQFYNETVTKEELNKCYSTNDSSRGSIADFDSDGYEEIGSDRLLISRPSAMDLITPKQGHHRTLWCEIPEVVQSEILKTLSKEERRFQEAKFEVMTSEASYFKSLTVLEKHFANSPAFSGDESVLPTEDRKSLFGHLTAVRRCSERLLAALDRCWQESIMLSHLSDVVSQHARQHFHVYVTYCTNQIDLNCTLRRLKDTNKRFEEELTRLESDPMCESLSLHSFLMLPMQRVTRMPLLMDAILSKLDTHHAEYQSSKAALRILNEFVQKCNEATRQQERVIEMVKLSRQLEFSQDVRTLPIVSQSRWLVRSGQVVQLNNSGDGGGGTQKQTFGRKLTRQGVKVMLFLFNDAMLVTKKKSDDCFIVLDHCPRNLIQMSAEEDVGTALRYLIKVAMLKNHEGKLVEMIVSCDSETSRQRWLQAVAPPQASEEGESVYEAWDCPQVIAIHVYRASQPDELSIQRGDVINVLRKMADGWYYGERTRDGEKGWFPGNHAQEIISQHIRARNLQQRYRLLMMSGSILESQKGNTNNKKQK